MNVQTINPFGILLHPAWGEPPNNGIEQTNGGLRSMTPFAALGPR
jgi:hypothetical protein